MRGKGGDICKTSASRKRKREGGLRGNDAMKVACLARGQDNCHSHACILPECGMFCTPELVVRARWCVPISLAHDRRNFASILTPRKERRKLLLRKLLRCKLLSSCPDVCCIANPQVCGTANLRPAFKHSFGKQT